MTEQFPVLLGAESFYIEGNDIGILISHGFVGTPQSVHRIGRAFSELGYTVCAPRLKGHGTHYLDLEKCTKEEWLASLEAGYVQLRERCSTIFVLGQSMGGTLAIQLANKYQEIAGLILINTALTIPSYEQYRNKTAPPYIQEGKPDIKAKDVVEITYDYVPLTAIQQVQQLMGDTVTYLTRTMQPVLAIKSRVDHVVPPANTDYIVRRIGSESVDVIVLENSYHVASMDHDYQDIVEHTSKFIISHCKQAVK